MMPIAQVFSPLLLFVFSQLSESAYLGNEAEKLRNSSATCDWFGTAPFCDGYCPVTWLEARRSSNRILDNGMTRYSDPTFGNTCLTGSKAFCCRPDTSDCNKRGKWMSSLNTQYSCETDRRTAWHRRRVAVSPVPPSTQEMTRGGVSGMSCNNIEMLGLRGRFSCGVIQWMEIGTSERIVETWYKIN